MIEPDPIVRQMTLSAEQQGAVQKQGDVAVTASAGAGKTRTLVARYLSLLAGGLSPRHVVAVTFTQKAAREMRNRVRQEVRRCLEREDLGEEERARWQEVYGALDAARIGTIHGLCGEILRHHPAEAGVDPRFEMLDEGQMALLRAQAVDEALAWAADDVAAARLFADWGEWELRTLVARLLAQRLDVEALRRTLPADLWGRVWEPRLAAIMGRFVDDEEVRGCMADLLTLRKDGTLARAEAAGDALAPLLRDLLRCWGTILLARAQGDWAGVAAQLGPLREALKQKGRKGNWTPADPKAIVKALQGIYDERLGEWLLRSGGTVPIDLDLDRRLAEEVLPQLLRVYERALRRYAEVRQERPALDFDDLEAGALRLLREHAAVRAYWQGVVRALLVDEFQDTNGRQRELIDLLDGGAGKRFVVGDGKQSIYRFRGADVTVFRQVRREIDVLGGGVDLATSYRAHEALIEGVNALLKPVLGEQEDPARPYVEPFARLECHREAPAPGLRPPYVELHLALGTKREGALEQAARALVTRLVELVESREVTLREADPDDGQEHERPLAYGDVAILCRASGSFAAYEGALDAAGVPFLTVAGRGFYDRPEVRDVLNALQALADPLDDLALAGLLRSPACGLSDMALYRLAQARRERGAPFLWATLSADDLGFLAGEAGLARRAREWLDRLHAMVGRVTVADVLKAFLDDTGYRAALLRAGQARGARNVAKLLSDAHASEIVGMGAFLEYVGQLRDVGTREGEAHTVAAGAVQVMSVHAAKGLEFPVVVIGDVGHRAAHTSGLLIDPELGVVPPYVEERLTGDTEGGSEVQKASSWVYRLAQRTAQDQEEAESDRLLYVAATRAREMLLLSGAVGRAPDGWLKRLCAALPLAELLQDATEGTGARTVTLLAEGQPVACTLYPAGADLPLRLAHAEVVPSAPPPPESLPLLRTWARGQGVTDRETREGEVDPPPRVWRVVPERSKPTAPAWVVGQIAHGALAQWAFPDDSRRDWYAWAAAEAQSCGVTDEREMRDAVSRARRMLDRFHDSILFARMDVARRLHEVPYSVIDDQGRLEQGAIDALFVEEGGWTLVEFKTDRVRGPEELDALLEKEDYVPQVARYLAAAERLLGARPRPVLCLLNYEGAVYLVTDQW